MDLHDPEGREQWLATRMRRAPDGNVTRIAILEDDRAQAEFVNVALASQGHVCHLFENAPTLVRQLKRQTFDLLIFDWNMPGMSGAQVLQWARGALPTHVPILFLSARNAPDDIAAMLNEGADDYIVKPASIDVLRARVAALLRRAQPTRPNEGIQQFGEFRFDLRAREVSRDGVRIELRAREFGVALELFRRIGQPVSRSHLLDLVWEEHHDISERTVDTHVSALRARLGLRANRGYVLSSIYGYGYRLESIAATA